MNWGVIFRIPIQQEDIAIINMHTLNTRTAKTKQLLTNTRGEINNHTVIIGDVNLQFPLTERSSRQEIKKETLT